MKKLSRRKFLRGAGGVALGLPFLEAMRPRMARAQEAATSPRRVIYVFSPNGDEVSRRMQHKHETEFVLGEFLEPLEAYRNEILVMEGLDTRYHNLESHERADNHQQGGANLGPWPSGEGSFPIGGADRNIGYIEGETVDTWIGKQVRADEPNIPNRHLVYRVGGPANNIWTVHSHDGAPGHQNPVPPEDNPWHAYARLFDGFDSGEPAAVVLERLQRRQSALDLVLGELGDLRRQLGADDRRKVDRHTEALRDIELSLQDPSGLNPACGTFDAGSSLDPYHDDNHEACGRLFFKIITMAFACDMTRVVNFAWAGNTNNRVYRNLTLSGQNGGSGHHTISHYSDPTSFSDIRLIKRHLWQLSTHLYEELKSMPEPDGSSMWDHTLIVHWDELAQGDTHAVRNLMAVITGGAEGYFRRGRYLDLGNQSAFSDLLVSSIHYMGYEDVARFGDPRLGTGGPVPGLT
jgi:hypothetical protein